MTVSDGRDPIAVTGRDVLVTQPSAKGMFRVIGGLKPGTAYTVRSPRSRRRAPAPRPRSAGPRPPGSPPKAGTRADAGRFR